MNTVFFNVMLYILVQVYSIYGTEAYIQAVFIFWQCYSVLRYLVLQTMASTFTSARIFFIFRLITSILYIQTCVREWEGKKKKITEKMTATGRLREDNRDGRSG